MKILIMDGETTTSNKGNFADSTNFLVNFGLKWKGDNNSTIIYHDDPLFVETIQKWVTEADMLVGTNIKFDIHWLENVGIKFNGQKIWELQLFHYALHNQRMKYISLNQMCEFYSIPMKLDVVKGEYWEKGIDTDKIPRDILTEYLQQDLICTEGVFDCQFQYYKEHNPSWFKTFRLDCVDLWTVIEMEREGCVLDVKGVAVELEKKQARKAEIIGRLANKFGGATVNFGSNDQLSVCLYGGTITEALRIPNGVYKSGARVGQVKYSIFKKEHTYPGIFTPPERSELAKKGYYSTATDVLQKIKAKKEDKWIIDELIELGELDKLMSSYLIKMPAMITSYNWKHSKLHGTFNHGITITSRLASATPNSQNFPGAFKRFVITRF